MHKQQAITLVVVSYCQVHGLVVVSENKDEVPMDSSKRSIVCEVLVNASAEAVWEAWTTEEGVRAFFAPDCRLNITPGGCYEMYFDPEASPGNRGGEGNVVLAVQKDKMLSFTWNAPPSLPEVRHQRTHVTLFLSSSKEGRTLVTLTHDGWGRGGQWDEAFAYFARAWGEIVLPGLSRLFAGDGRG